MESEVSNIVEAILTAILQWRVSWLDEQRGNPNPPPICRSQPKKLKITYDSYKDYESTFVPLLMHEIWAQIFEACTRSEPEVFCPMDVDSSALPCSSNGKNALPLLNPTRAQPSHNPQNLRQFWIGIADYKSEGPYQCKLKCQFLIESNKVASHLKLVGEGDLVRLDLVTLTDPNQPKISDYGAPNLKTGTSLLSLFAYVADVTSERVNQYTSLADCFVARQNNRHHHVINYHIVIAKRPLRLKLSEPMKLTCLYYLKPMIRQIESVATLKESALASDILSPKMITCQLTVPTIAEIKSPHYNDMQYRAIIGANEALVRNIPKIQLIQGPPGTGKTHTLIGIIKHFYFNWRNISKIPKILICAPSNGAIDEVARRLHKEREFLKKSPAKRSLRMVRIGHPDQISESVRGISLEELVETNANAKIDGLKKRHTQQVRELEEELSKLDTEIANLRYSRRDQEIPKVEAKIARLFKELETSKANEEVNAKRETSDAAKRQMRYELIKNADVILTTLNSCQRYPLDAMFKGDRAELSFQCVIVDEASQCCEPELLMPLCYRISRVILIGDPMQLPATVISRYAQGFDFGRSLFERFFIHFGLYSPTSPIAMLTDQYRMHPDICSFPSKQFYDGRLVSARALLKTHPMRPYVLFDLRHGADSKSNKTSLENEVEASLVRNLLLAVLKIAPENSKIGVITPYKGQKRLITHKIAALTSEKGMTVDVNTCDGFQGQEKDIIILSCVRASDSGSVGFLKSYQRVNVALTRAKHSLLVCVSTKALMKDKTWETLINDAMTRRCVETLTQTPTSAVLSKMVAKSQFVDPPNSSLTRADAVNSNGLEYEPEYIIPMDID